MRTTSPVPDRRTPSARAALAVVVLAVVLLGLVAPAAQAAAPSTSTTTTTSTQNVGPRPGWAHDTVHVQNDASGRCPVQAATDRLGHGSPLRLVIVPACPVRTSSAQPPVPCINVTSRDLGRERSPAPPTGPSWRAPTS